jgi:hypothetical protein
MVSLHIFNLATNLKVCGGTFHKYKDQTSVPELEADKVYACCNLCGRNISSGKTIGTGGLAKHIKSMHLDQLKYVPAAQGGTLDVDIATTIKKRKFRDGNVAVLWTNSSHSMAKRKEQQLESTSLFLAMDNVPTDVVQ